MNLPEDFRKNAADCRDLAKEATDPTQKAQWLKLADEWLRVAEASYSRPDAFDAK
jgi:hypothetical protein